MKKNKLRKIGLNEKIFILILQILLPFALYMALNRGSRPVELLIGILFALSMLVLILMG